MHCGHPRLCVCLSACAHYCTDPDVTWGVVGDAPSCALLGAFAIDARVALLWQHYGNAWQSRAVIRQAHRTTHALRMPAKTPLAGDKIDAPAACAVPFRPYCGGVVTRTRNVSECMVVLALCLVNYKLRIRVNRYNHCIGLHCSQCTFILFTCCRPSLQTLHVFIGKLVKYISFFFATGFQSGEILYLSINATTCW